MDSGRNGSLSSCWASQKDDVDATVLHAPVFGGIASNGVEFGVACSGEIGRVDGASFEKEAGDSGRSCGGELPVAGELRSVNGNVVGVTFDAERALRKSFREDGDHGDGRGAYFS